ncbi:nucleotide-diphospho-sugar transferase [Eremomyces bilateralis CBS 781.70]|uniref:dolichyl-phosphate beta-glucosyltransferase n=1 Tax=Eremomyces bilateralis CBS 781.70 TaxID=1392243 RepID=A0A6G1FZH3_9PEZI|nr:nucleotide-diphospho-sugar transferase [Eremomyces bilateralis CBS 781.70]KAF1811194.1 nucleotide-diphospho-sugar transferase [Eremomyces bilateralis CBS 781.70]
MDTGSQSWHPLIQLPWTYLRRAPVAVLLAVSILLIITAVFLLYTLLVIAAPIPRESRPGEKAFRTVLRNGKVSGPKQLPCWIDRWKAAKQLTFSEPTIPGHAPRPKIDDAELLLSVVVPAYNEEKRLGVMLDEAVSFLRSKSDGSAGWSKSTEAVQGWEILVVSDGSTDKTEDKAIAFARERGLIEDQGAETKDGSSGTYGRGCLRVISLEHNRGKGGAVVHGMRHVRGQYIVFADADGASQFSDIAGLLKACQAAEDEHGRAVAIGSRAHLVGSEVVVKRSMLRNFLMHSFHLLLWILTPPATASIKDTQCGFKLFSRASLPDIVPFMHSEGWIFDVEMLMLAESARVPMVEVPIGWKEVPGSKLNVVWASLGMAWGLAVLRCAWALGVYKRK